MSDVTQKLRELATEGREIDERIRKASAQSAKQYPARHPSDVWRDRRAAPGRTR